MSGFGRASSLFIDDTALVVPLQEAFDVGMALVRESNHSTKASAGQRAEKCMAQQFISAEKGQIIHKSRTFKLHEEHAMIHHFKVVVNFNQEWRERVTDMRKPYA